jgi:hypothetical protein
MVGGIRWIVSRGWVLAIWAALPACNGEVGELPEHGSASGPKGTGMPSSTGVIGDPGSMPVDTEAAGPLGFRRLTQREYVNTLTDLFPGVSFTAPADTDADGDFGFAQAAVMSDDTAQQLLETGETVAGKAVTNLDQSLGCSVATKGEQACTTTFLDTFGRRVYRRPLESAEKDELSSLAASLASDGYALADRIRVLVTTMLQAPAFLYRWELGTASVHLDGKVIELGPYELASRLSHFLWSSAPDDALLDAAAAGKLDSDADLDAQIERMTGSDKFQRTVESFHSQWLGLGSLPGISKDPTLFPQFNDALKTAMASETLRFVDDLFTVGSGRLSDLFGSSTSFVNADLAPIYGVTGVTGTGLRKVELDPTQRAGILTQASLLATLSNPGGTVPPRSGHMVYTNLLCQHIAPAPPGAAQQFKPDAALSTRQNFSVLETTAGCKACHAILNPLGYAFESFDPIGHFRTEEGDHPIDASGALTTSAGTKRFANAVELGGLLANDPDAQSCVARKWLRFALARVETSGDAYSLQTSFQQFQASGFDVRAFLRAAATSRTFRFRAPEDGEVLQ